MCNKFSEQKCFDKPAFKKISRLNHSPPIYNTVTNKVKHFPQFYGLPPQIALKIKIALISFLINHCHQTKYIRL